MTGGNDQIRTSNNRDRRQSVERDTGQIQIIWNGDGVTVGVNRVRQFCRRIRQCGVTTHRECDLVQVQRRQITAGCDENFARSGERDVTGSVKARRLGRTHREVRAICNGQIFQVGQRHAGQVDRGRCRNVITPCVNGQRQTRCVCGQDAVGVQFQLGNASKVAGAQITARHHGGHHFNELFGTGADVTRTVGLIDGEQLITNFQILTRLQRTNPKRPATIHYRCFVALLSNIVGGQRMATGQLDGNGGVAFTRAGDVEAGSVFQRIHHVISRDGIDGWCVGHLRIDQNRFGHFAADVARRISRSHTDGGRAVDWNVTVAVVHGPLAT